MFVITLLVTHSCDKRLLVCDETNTKLIFTLKNTNLPKHTL
jgi:hypothetical protein